MVSWPLKTIVTGMTRASHASNAFELTFSDS